jgi:hypothetical protein
MVTKTCANGPVGPLQVAGSLTITVAEAVAGVAGVDDPPLLHAVIHALVNTNPEVARTTQ